MIRRLMVPGVTLLLGWTMLAVPAVASGEDPPSQNLSKRSETEWAYQLPDTQQSARMMLAQRLKSAQFKVARITPDLSANQPSNQTVGVNKRATSSNKTPKRYTQGTTVSEPSQRNSENTNGRDGDSNNGSTAGSSSRGFADSTYNGNPIRMKQWYIGAAYPGAVIGYQFSPYSIDVRGYARDDVTLYGPRFTHYIYPFEGGNLYWGVDGFYVHDFEGDLTEGDGYMTGPFVGVQKYLGDYISFNVDSGPYYLDLEDDLSGLSVDGFEFVVNTHISVHF